MITIASRSSPRSSGDQAGDREEALAGRSYLLLAGAPFLLASLVYCNILTNDFAYDDVWKIGVLESWHGRWIDALKESRGLTFVTLLVDYRIYGAAPFGFHLTNIILHGIASSTVAYTASRFSRSVRVGVVTGLLFAVHPVHVDAVASITNRKDLLALVFGFTAILFWIHRQRGGMRTAAMWLATAVSLVFAFKSKEIVAAGLLPFFPISDWLIRSSGSVAVRRTQSVGLGVGAAVIMILVLYVGFTYYLAEGFTARFSAPGIVRLTEASMDSYESLLATSAGAIPDRFRLLLFPKTLSFDYPVNVQATFASPRAIAGLTLLGVWLIATLALWKRRRVYAFSMLWVVVTYIPYSNLIPVVHFTVADRYLYVPSFGVCLIVALLLNDAFSYYETRRRRLPAAACVCVLVLLVVAGSARTIERNRDWENNERLVASAIASGMDTWRVNRMAGLHAYRARRFRQAFRFYEHASELQPMSPALHYRVAEIQLLIGGSRGVMERVKIADDLRAYGRLDSIASYRLGLAMLQRNMQREAFRRFEVSQEIHFANPNSKIAMWCLLAASSDSSVADPPRVVAAAGEIERRFSQKPVALWSLAIAYLNTDRAPLAWDILRKAQSAALRAGDEEWIARLRELHPNLRQDMGFKVSGPELHMLLRSPAKNNERP